ncbi:MAG: hypothetical protein JXR46_15330 [Calditrichaceae bacterium]|nr:hypothetical protein [Calditrichaceae bacterium]MBN2710415.1 hypothetical protein [Calditrichaceae bacterium]RQV94589.1 MAG: transporter [Calditrichota bacterium]
MFDYLQDHQVILLFLIIALGLIIGRIKIWGFSFESSAILFVAMAFGHYGFTLNSDFMTLGLIFFIYSIGLQAGPSIFNISRKQGFRLNLIVLLLLVLGALTTYLTAVFFNLDMDIAVGLFAGAFTSTPGLAAAQEATQSPLTSTGYGLAYPFGVIGVILFIKLMPVIFRSDLKKEESDEQIQQEQEIAAVDRLNIEITSESLENIQLKNLQLIRNAGLIISRIAHDNEILVAGPKSVLHKGDVIRVVGTKNAIKSALPLLGKKSSFEFPQGVQMESRRFVITNKDIVGKSIAELNLHETFDANITRVRRSGVDILARPDFRLRWGDRVRVVGEINQMDAIRNFFGDEMKKIEYGNIFSIFLGILLGITAGLIPFSVGKIIAFNLGITGGVLLAGLVLSNRGKVGPVVWQVPAPITAFMRELGLILFLAIVGIQAGSDVVETMKADGIKLVAAGAVITLLPMILITFFSRFRYKCKIIELIGIISGGMTSTPGLAAGTGMTESQTPLLMYATVYPFAMILMMLMAKILILF